MRHQDLSAGAVPGGASGVHKVVRGGAFYLDASYLRGAQRGLLKPQHSYKHTGFRCARSLLGDPWVAPTDQRVCELSGP